MFISQTIRDKFPEAWIRAGHPLDAAISLGLLPMEAYEISRTLAADDSILEAKAELLKTHGLEYFLPNQIETASEILTQARRTQDDTAKVKLYTLYCGLRGFVTKTAEQETKKELQVLVRSVLTQRSLASVKTIDTTVQ